MKKFKDLDIILLIDDDEATNYYNESILQKLEVDAEIIVTYGAQEALNYLQNLNTKNNNTDKCKPGLIFLDINMPGMSGWDFLEEYNQLNENQKAKFVIAMLTTSLNPDDKEKSTANNDINNFIYKPLSESQITEIIEQNFERIK